MDPLFLGSLDLYGYIPACLLKLGPPISRDTYEHYEHMSGPDLIKSLVHQDLKPNPPAHASSCSLFGI